MVRTDRVLEPNKDAHEEYNFFKQQYNDVYQAAKDVLNATAKHVGG